MNRPNEQPPAPRDQPHLELAKPVLKKMRWPFPLVWLVPIAAAIAAGIYLYLREKDRGREIVIEFADAASVQVEETVVRVHGVEVGQVTATQVSPDHSRAEIHVRLKKNDEFVAREGTKFWIVRPDFSEGGFTGLGTIVSGAYIEALPGDGKEQTKFDGVTEAPVMTREGVKWILHAPRVEKLQVGSQVQYRGTQVGVVQDMRLSSDASEVNVTIFIWKRYLPLVRVNSKFWLVSGADLHGGILTNLSFKLGSLQSLLSGSVSFATPDEPGDLAPPDGFFYLYSEPKDEWLKWIPHIHLPPEEAGDQQQQTAAPKSPKPPTLR
jgi:paraquat-inducible protein B